MQIMTAFFNWLTVICVLLPFCSAIFHDEAFKTDWIDYQYGNLIPTSLNPIISNDTIVSLTDAKQLVSLQFHTGAIQWRHDLDFTSGDLISFQGKIVSGLNTADGSSVKFWKQDGSLIDEFVVSSNKIVKLFNYQNKDVLIIYSNGDIKLLEGTKDTLNIGIDDIENAVLSSYNGQVIIVSVSKGQTFYSIVDKDFKISAKNLISKIDFNDLIDIVGNIVNFKSKVLVINENSKKNKIIDLSGSNARVSGSFIATFLDDSSTLTIQDLSSSKVKTFQLEDRLIDVVSADDYFIVYTERSVSTIDLELEFNLHTFKGDFSKFSAGFSYVHTELIEEGSENDIYTVVGSKSDDLVVMRNNETVWSKDTSLSSIISFAVLDTDHHVEAATNDLLQEENLSTLFAYIFRLKNDFKKLTSAKTENEKSLDIQDNYFGFTKKLVVATESGKVKAINSETGEVLWTYVAGFPNLKVETFSNLVYVFIPNDILFLNSDGELVGSQELTGQVEKVFKSNEGLFAKLSSGDILDITKTNSAVKFFTEVSPNGKYLSGLKLEGTGVSETWKFEVGKDEKIVSATSKLVGDESASMGLVLGDRSVLYKFLYPNVVALAITNDISHGLTVSLIDSITGEKLFSKQHTESIDPSSINVVFGEHWVIYSYFSFEPEVEQRIVVLDLFESLTPNQRISSNTETSRNNVFQVSSETFLFPERITKLAISKTKFGVTTRIIIAGTASGQLVNIPKFILNSRRVHDRPLTVEEMQEYRLSQYDPIIRKVDRAVLNHVRPISNIKQIISIPTELESTSIICAYGLDLFCTRVQPSSQFDSLGPGFDKVKLIGTIVILIAGVFITKPMVTAKKLNACWIDR